MSDANDRTEELEVLLKEVKNSPRATPVRTSKGPTVTRKASRQSAVERRRKAPRRVAINARVLGDTDLMIDILAIDRGTTRQDVIDKAVHTEFRA